MTENKGCLVKKNIGLLLLSSLSLYFHNVYANTLTFFNWREPDLIWVGSLSVGPTWNSSGRKQTIFLAPEIEKTYTAKQPINTVTDGELFIGLQKSLYCHQFQGQLGFAFATTDDTSLNGNIWDDANPAFNNYTYHYQIQHAHIALKGKLLADMGYWVIPWVSASVGVGFNRAHAFNNTPTIFEAVANANFTSHTQTTFTYTLAIGAQKQINCHWQVGAGYEFADWGKSNLGRARGQTLGNGLTLNHLYSNGVLFNVTYLA